MADTAFRLKSHERSGSSVKLGAAEVVVLSAGIFALGFILNWTIALTIIHELFHAAVALLFGAKTVRVEWSIMYTSNTSAWITYAGYWGEMFFYSGMAILFSVKRRPVFAAFGLGALIPPVVQAPTSPDFTVYALEAIPPAAAQVVTVAFIVVWIICMLVSFASYTVAVVCREQESSA